MDLKTWEKKCRRVRTIMILWSIWPFVAIPCMITCFVTGFWYLGIPFALTLMASFYGITLGWALWYTSVRYKRNIIRAITNGARNINEIAMMTYRRAKTVANDIQKLIMNGHIVGFRLDPVKMMLVETTAKPKKDPEPEVAPRRTRCENCGAPLRYGDKTCAHCNTMV